MSAHHDRIASHLSEMHDRLRLLREDVELIDGSDPRNRERRGAMRASVGMIEYLIKGLNASAGYMNPSAYQDDTPAKEI